MTELAPCPQCHGSAVEMRRAVEKELIEPLATTRQELGLMGAGIVVVAMAGRVLVSRASPPLQTAGIGALLCSTLLALISMLAAFEVLYLQPKKYAYLRYRCASCDYTWHHLDTSRRPRGPHQEGRLGLRFTAGLWLMFFTLYNAMNTLVAPSLRKAEHTMALNLTLFTVGLFLLVYLDMALVLLSMRDERRSGLWAVLAVLSFTGMIVAYERPAHPWLFIALGVASAMASFWLGPALERWARSRREAQRNK